MKDEFLATVSHEIPTPLNAIIGWSHLLRSGSLDEAMSARAVETIDRNAKAQAQLIEDILDVSRMITGKLRLDNEPVDIASVINAAIDSVQLAIDSKDLQLEVTLDPSARHTVGDASRLQQVVWNLLALASADATRRRKATGSLQLKESSQKGVTSLPSLCDVKVLLVDDDPDTLQILSVMLGESKAVVQTANSVSVALEVLEWYQPDVLVSDLAMPGEDGYSLIGKLRALEAKSGRQTPVVALTSHVRVEDRARALSAGFNMFVPKPVQPDELITAIANLAEVVVETA